MKMRSSNVRYRHDRASASHRSDLRAVGLLRHVPLGEPNGGYVRQLPSCPG
jgi:hypothetical protein